MIRTILTSASALALVAGAAIAQDMEESLQIETPQTVGVDFVTEAPTLDAKSVTTKDDARLFAVAEFNLVDINADGKIDQEEFVAYATASAKGAEADTANEVVAEAAEIEGEGDVAAIAEATTAPEEIFAEISEGEETIDQVKMVEARIADFDEADANNDETLDASEKEQFAALVTGKKSS